MSTSKLPPDHFSDELPSSIGRPANAALVALGVTSLAQVAQMTERDLRAAHGVGPKAVRILAEELDRRGLSFAAS